MMNIRHFLFLGILALGLALPTATFAATLSLSPSASTVAPGQTVTVSVLVSSANQAMNATAGVVSFPSDKLEVTSLSKTSSVMNLWVQEPSYSNAVGTVSFEGVVLNPGFVGTSGKVLTITFRAKSEGTAKLSFGSGSVLANDGRGTELLSGSNGTTITIQGGAPVPPADASTPGVAAGVAITSPTHPDQAKWYADGSPEFRWTLPTDAREVRTLIGENAKGIPTIRYAPPISTKTVENLEDGTYYFHVQVRAGEEWGATSRFRVNIDKTPPKKFRVTFPNGSSGMAPQPTILFETTDDTSGVEYYEVKVGDEAPVRTMASTDANPYMLSTQEPGSYAVVVTAVDRAGNATSAGGEFVIEGINPPTITSYTEDMTVGELLRINGTTYPNAMVDIAVSADDGPVVTESVQSNATGEFGILISKRLWPGTYTFTARVTDDRGARSRETEPYSVTVRFHFFSDAVTFILNYFFIMLAILLGIVILVAIGIWSWFKLLCLTRILKKESDEAQSVLHRSFQVLKSDLAGHIRKLQRARVSRSLTGEEVEFLERFGAELTEAEEVIAKEVADIPETLKRKKKPSSRKGATKSGRRASSSREDE